MQSVYILIQYTDVETKIISVEINYQYILGIANRLTKDYKKEILDEEIEENGGKTLIVWNNEKDRYILQEYECSWF